SRRRHTIFSRDWSSDVCSSDLVVANGVPALAAIGGVAGVAVVTCGAAAQVIDQIEVVAAAQYIAVVVDVLQLVPVGDGPGSGVCAPAAVEQRFIADDNIFFAADADQVRQPAPRL